MISLFSSSGKFSFHGVPSSTQRIAIPSRSQNWFGNESTKRTAFLEFHPMQNVQQQFFASKKMRPRDKQQGDLDTKTVISLYSINQEVFLTKFKQDTKKNQPRNYSNASALGGFNGCSIGYQNCEASNRNRRSTRSRCG
jgi:hypothetical protein